MEEKYIVFGAGNIAKKILPQMLAKKKNIVGIAVTNKNDNPKSILGIRVDEIDSYMEYTDAHIVLGVSEVYEEEVQKLIKDKGLRKAEKYDILPMRYSKFSDIDMQTFVALWYFFCTGQELDWNNLETFNEKMQWLKLYDSTSLKSALTDKYKVRDYVRDNIGEKYLIPLLGVWDSFDEINFEELPQKFVLKCNHGCGFNEIVSDKNMMDFEESKKRFNEWMSIDFSDIWGLELQYKPIERKIIAEELLEIPQYGDVPDYKFFVFDGEIKLIQVDYERRNGHSQALFTPDWERLPYSLQCPYDEKLTVEKPKDLNEMKEIASKLGSGFRHVRVDLYYVSGEIKFGEMTFTHCSGIGRFEPLGFARLMGDWVNIEN